MNATRKKQVNDPGLDKDVEQTLSNALEMVVRELGLVNGTITITARGGQLCRGIEIVNKVDVQTFE